MKPLIYADNCATTMPCIEALDAFASAASSFFGNPSGLSPASQRASRQVFLARQTVAECTGTAASNVYFTSGGTESDNLALYSAARHGLENQKDELLVSAIEHHAVLRSAHAYQALGCTVRIIPVLPSGMVDLNALGEMLSERTALVSVMHANNETGVIQPVAEIGKLCSQHGVLFHIDAVQTMCKLAADMDAFHADYLSISAHKFHGAAGAGALCISDRAPLSPLFYGGRQEQGIRPGTENVPALAAMRAAIEHARCASNRYRYVAALTEQLERELLKMRDIRIVGAESPRVAGVSCITLGDGVDGEAAALELGREGLCVSSGAACTTGEDAPGHVLTAMGFPPALAKSALRISLSEYNTEDEIELAVSIMRRVLNR